MPENKVYRFAQNIIAPVVKTYSRLTVVGEENLPAIGQGALFVCNHSGSFWWDALCLVSALKDRRVHFIAHHWDASISMLRKPLDLIECDFLDECEDRIHDQCDVVRGLKAGKQMCIYPEESYHSFKHRYTLFQFGAQMIRYAEFAQVPILPITIIGVEEAAPTLLGYKRPSVPLHVPFHFPIILPVKVTIDIGKPITADALKGQADQADVVRQAMYRTMSEYRSCRLSNEKYIEKKSWFF